MMHFSWPGFDPARVPLAVYDGVRTILTGHPRPPADFVDDQGSLVYEGLHPAVRADTAVELGGCLTATVLGDTDSDLPPRIAHETFHVFQQTSHPSWRANELYFFVYPVDDIEAVSLRQMEAEALRRALVDQSAAWVATATDLRRKRYQNLPARVIRYEREWERFEGLAQYVEGKRRCLAGLRKDSPVDQLRPLAGHVGEAIGLLLDVLVPAWKERLEAGDERYLDQMLRVEEPPAEFTSDDMSWYRSGAQREIDALRLTRSELREAFFARSGRAVLLAKDEPMQNNGCDPTKLHYLGNGEVLHMRWLKLSGNGIELEVLDGGALTESAGEHPLFGGFRRVTF